ncbi:protein MAIN-LIKE 2-like [Senna tora]|uniref:Protein MAIN-LIKE 2-like n=1 Tax=Senna tora TaxID=362788 RepID=A0A834X904_9FABA|nr:protein MAIN-LIKE 2-like [Senna tora]
MASSLLSQPRCVYSWPAFINSALIALFLNLELRLLATWRMQKTLWPNGSCQPVPRLSRAASNPVPRSEIKHTSRSFETCSRSLHKNHDHAYSVSPSTSANATGMMFLFLSCPIAINSECLYLPYRNVPSTCSIGFSCHHASIHGLNAQNIRLNWTTLSSPGMSTVWNDTAVSGMACCTADIQPVSLSYEATQLPYTRAMTFCFPYHAFLYETSQPLVKWGCLPSLQPSLLLPPLSCPNQSWGGPSRLRSMHSCGGRCILKSSTAKGPPCNLLGPSICNPWRGADTCTR